MKNCYFDSSRRYIQPEFGRQPVFSSFLPGIAGPWGIPAWCNYNNRGQAVCSFGVQDKDHAILEFTAAATAYQRTPLTGFRTFIKEDGTVTEAFADGLGTMVVEPNTLMLTWGNRRLSLEVVYFTLPNERMAGLCRKLRITNTAPEAVRIELLDGLAAMVPYGISDEKLKQEANLSTAWMQVENLDEGLPYYRVRASLEDSARVTAVAGGNFKLAFVDDGELLPTIVQPDLVFGWDTAMIRPAAFAGRALADIVPAKQLTGNFMPCCLTPWEGSIRPGESVTMWEFYGQSADMTQMRCFAKKANTHSYFEKKLEEARKLPAEITAPARCETADPVFDAYAAQNFLDNVMRGGLPCRMGKEDSNPVYLYSRKHGDPEREYNYFSLSREYFSQGNAHFRDICQNRRSDVLVNTSAGEFNLRLFFELLQTDGYNPLVLEPVSYRLHDPEQMAQIVAPQHRDRAREILSKPFSIGRLAMETEDWHMHDIGGFLAKVISDADMEPNANFQEGYWSDHWTYLLDLLETVLSVFPDRARELLFGQPRYRWYARHAAVRPQAKRYCMTENGLRQYHCIDRENPAQKWTRTQTGEQAQSNLAEKLLLLCAIKYATLDSSGAAVEMEGGKPGWYDALNGLPGLLGSSVAEGCELLRVLDFLLERIPDFPNETRLYSEIADLLRALYALENKAADPYHGWIERNALRDRYRADTAKGFAGTRGSISREELAQILGCLARKLRMAIARVTNENHGICPTYFYYEAAAVKKVDDGILPMSLKRVCLPLFLEGPTRWLRTKQEESEKQKMVQGVGKSDLLDRKLRMYRLNASLSEVSYEVGRTRAFPPGWLENGSIWLHMEYKYLLSLLECGMYDQFFNDLENTAIPFLDLNVYKRSTLENSSFLMSSANADEESHGRGYVSRLSGSTAEFISIWNQMFFGKAPFGCDSGRLYLRLQPAVPRKLIRGKNVLKSTFLGSVSVIYHLQNVKELKPGTYRISGCRLWSENDAVWIEGGRVWDEQAERVRSGAVTQMDVYFESV